MKNITLNPNSKIAKTAKFTFNYLHLIIIIAVLLLLNVETAQAQSMSRSAAPGVQVQPENTVSELPGNPSTTTASYNAFSKNKSVSVSSSKLIVSVGVYDLSGRVLFGANGIYQYEYKTPALDSPRQLVVVKALFDNNTSASRNIVLN